MNYKKRISEVRKYMQENKINGLFLSPSGDAEYLTGIRRQRMQANATSTHLYGDWLYGLFMNKDSAIYVTPSMVKAFPLSQVKGKAFINDVLVLEEGKDLKKYARQIISRLKLEKGIIAVPKFVLGKTLIRLKELFPEIKFVCTEDFVSKMRMIKDQEEIEIMKKACQITDEIFIDVVKKVKVGMTEIDVAREIDYQMLLKGAEGTSFTTGIMLQGPGNFSDNEKLKRTENSILEYGNTLSFDFGLVYNGYVSDFGRTIYIGEPNKLMKRVHKIVIASQKAAIESMIAGKITAEEVDNVARSIINREGFEKEFSHRLGHGIGIDVHENPFLNIGYKTVLQEGMTFTVEPDIVIKGKLFIRVEDIILVTPSGGKCLNNVTKDIIVIE
jgi:Xaa-Pro aminopeptidase